MKSGVEKIPFLLVGYWKNSLECRLEGNSYKGTRKVIDFSGDSSYSGGGVYVHVARAAALADGIIINGLAILCRDCSGRPADLDLELAFEETGPHLPAKNMTSTVYVLRRT